MTDLISREALERRCKGSYLTPDDFRFEIRNAPAIEQDKRVTSFAWALIMETAASFEVASYSISDADAKKSAEGAIKYARDAANKYYTTPQQPQEQDELVKKAVADVLEEEAKLWDDGYKQYQVLVERAYIRGDVKYALDYELKSVQCKINAHQIRTIIKRNAEEGE